MCKTNFDRRRQSKPEPTRKGIAMLAASVALATFVIGVMLTSPWSGPAAVPAEAYEIPAAGSVFYIQTNGPNAAVGLGDWYTATSVGAGAGHHYATINIPCGWPAGTPVYIDLFSPEMNRVSGALNLTEEPTGNYDSTQFELYGPGASVGPGFAAPAPGAGIPGSEVTYEPGAAGVPEAWVRFATINPATCGNYVLRSSVLANDPANPSGEGNDQNGWRLRVGWDNDADPTNAPPANADDLDGVPGTNDEITSGLVQISFQHDAGGTACQTFYEYVDPSLSSVTFNDFDFDGNGRVRYYAPSAVYDPTGLSGGTPGSISAATGTWNVSNTISRGGDVITNPEPGWWRIVTCISNHNQYIEEGQPGLPVYYAQPPTPKLTVTKTDGVATVSPGDLLTYIITIDNTATGATAGAATNVVATDTLPSNATFTGCAITAPASGSCSEVSGVVTMNLAGAIVAGGSAQFTIDVTVNGGASGSVQNDVSVAYADSIGNAFAPVSAGDVDALATPTHTATSTATTTQTPSAVASPTVTATNTPAVTDTPTTTNTPPATNTPPVTNTPTTTNTPPATNTPPVTNTPAATNTPIATNTPAATTTPAATDTAVATMTPGVTGTATATTTLATANTATVTLTPIVTSTATPGTPPATVTPVSGAASANGDSTGGSGLPPQSAPTGGEQRAMLFPNAGSGSSHGSRRPLLVPIAAMMLAAAGGMTMSSAMRRRR